jgi:uncharacterized protein YegL
MALVPDDLAINRQERCPVVLALDVSSSMADCIGELNAALVQFKNDLIEDQLASLRIEIAIVTFDDKAHLLQDFVNITDFHPRTLTVSGTTAMGSAMDLALKTIEARKTLYRSSGIRYFRPWIWLMSDGAPNDAGWEAAADRVKAAQAAKKVQVYGVGIGAAADLATLARFATAEPPVRVQPGMFRNMFAWLSTSLQMQSNSTPVVSPGGGENVTAVTAAGDQIKLPPVDWGTLK